MRTLLYFKMIAMTCMLSQSALSENLFKINGKTVHSQELTPALQQMIFDAEDEKYHKMVRVAEEGLIETYLQNEAQKRKTTVKAILASEIKVEPVNDKEAKEWYEQNKSRLGGRDFALIKNEIQGYLANQKQAEARRELIEKLKTKLNFKLLVEEPIAPKMAINSAGFPFKGNEKASVEIIEFADYGCPHCKHAAEIMKDIINRYGSKIKFTFMDFPLNPSGMTAAIAEGAHCAGEQDKFWEYHYMAFEKQTSLNQNSPTEFAKILKINSDKFNKCLANGKMRTKVEQSRKEGDRIGINGTPAIYLNGRKVKHFDLDNLSKAIDKALSQG